MIKHWSDFTFDLYLEAIFKFFIGKKINFLTFQALYLLHKAFHSGRHHMTFCCSKQLNRTFLLSSLTRPLFIGDVLASVVFLIFFGKKITYNLKTLVTHCSGIVHGTVSKGESIFLSQGWQRGGSFILP